MTRKKNRPTSRFASVLSKVMLGTVVFVVLFALLSAAITPERYDIQIGQPAPNTIKATKDVEDTITTKAEKAKAAGKVGDIFTTDPNVAEEVIKDAQAKFELFKQISKNAGESAGDSGVISANELLQPLTISAEEYDALSNANEEDLDTLFARTVRLLNEAFSNTLAADKLMSAREDIVNALVNDFDMSLISVVDKTLEDVLRPNHFKDEAATKKAKEAEMDKVKTITHIKGEVIVSDGEIVTEAHYEMLRTLGIVKESNLDITLYYGVAMLVLLLMAAVIVYIALFDPEIMKSTKELFLLSLISVIVIGVSVLVRDVSPYLMPTTLAILLVSQLVKRRLAIVMNVVLSVGISLFASSSTGFFNMTMFTIVVNSIVSGMVALLVLKKKKQQRTITLIAGVAVGVSNMICTIAIGFVNNANLRTVLILSEWSAGSGILAAILCIALMPILEGAFNIVTPNKLLELSNPNQPLLRRLLLEAPGTYHHSIIVANLAEAAAGEIGANALLARVGAYYHDVGKLKRPSYFKENQMGDNPHDRTDPRVSTAILTAHTRDAVRMLQRERIPEPIIAIVASHHGDTPVMYFYNKSRMENGDDVKIDDFRYDGPRPQSKEAAIVMLADTVEAAARSLPNPDSEKLNSLIRNLVRQKMEDGQLDYCELTFGDVDRICSSFLTVLSGVFHERIEYPSIEIPKKQKIKALPEQKTTAENAQTEEKKADKPAENEPAEEEKKMEEAVLEKPSEDEKKAEETVSGQTESAGEAEISKKADKEEEASQASGNAEDENADRA